jgi:hypothetical protein
VVGGAGVSGAPDRDKHDAPCTNAGLAEVAGALK